MSSTLARRRRAGHDPRPFRGGRSHTWFLVGVLLLAALAVAPILWPTTRAVTERLNPLLSLFFLLAAAGFLGGRTRRVLPLAAIGTLALYAITAWTRLAFSLHDLYVVSVLVGLLIYALAGFNVVFILEEAVYDAHRLLHLRHPAWSALPVLVVALLAGGLPFLPWIWLPMLWIASLACAALLGGWWFVRAVNGLGQGPVTRELHLLAAGVLASAALLDAVQFLEAHALASTLLVYAALLGTWVYVSYTTPQRTQLLLRARNVRPWLALLLAASFAVLGHAQLLYGVGGSSALAVLLDQRVGYVVAGIVVGLAFLVARGAWRVLRHLRDDLPRGSRIVHAAEALLRAEQRVEAAAARVVGRQEEWELDPDGLRRVR